jgi:hypothetical protein
MQDQFRQTVFGQSAVDGPSPLPDRNLANSSHGNRETDALLPNFRKRAAGSTTAIGGNSGTAVTDSMSKVGSPVPPPVMIL